MTTNELREAARKVLALSVQDDETADHLLARLLHCGPQGAALRREFLEKDSRPTYAEIRDRYNLDRNYGARDD